MEKKIAILILMIIILLGIVGFFFLYKIPAKIPAKIKVDPAINSEKSCAQIFEETGECPEKICEVGCGSGGGGFGCTFGCLDKDCQEFSLTDCPLSRCSVIKTSSGEDECYHRFNNLPECGGLGHYSGIPCCEGFSRKVGKVMPDGSCDYKSGGYDNKFPYCLACGDGQCGVLENKCNCPEDCLII